MSSNDAPTPKPFNDELLCAYLDEHLSDAERARVELHLAENVEARQLLDELAAVSGAVRSLPVLTVDDRFTSDILHSPRLAGGTSAPVEPDAIPISVGRSARGWVWAALAVAAALLVMFINGERLSEDREVANVEEPAGTGETVAIDREISRDDGRNDAAITADEVEELVAKDDGKNGFARGVDELRKPAASASVATETTDETEFVRGKGGSFVPVPEPLTTNPSVTPQPKSNGLWGVRGGVMPVPSDAPEGVHIAKTAERSLVESPGSIQAPAIEYNKTIQSFLDVNNIQLAEDEPVLVVQVDLTPEAARNQAFNAVLTNNSISYKYETTDAKELGESELGVDLKGASPQRNLSKAAPHGNQLAEDSSIGRRELDAAPDQSHGAIQRRYTERLRDDRGDTTDGIDLQVDALVDNTDKRVGDASSKNTTASPYDEVVLIDATPTQLLATLNEINNDRGNYRQLQIDPSNEMSETKNQWNQYHREQVANERTMRRQFDRKRASSKASSQNHASGVQPPTHVGAGGMGGGVRLGSADTNSRSQASEQMQGHAVRFRVNQNQQNRHKTRKGRRNGVSLDSDLDQDGPTQQEQTKSDELPLTQLEQQLRYSLGDGRIGNGPSIRQKGAQDRIWAIFLLRVVPRQIAVAAEESADEP